MLIPRMIPLLTEEPLADVLKEPFIAPLLPPLLERHHEGIKLIRERAEYKDGVIYFDITDRQLEGYNKFIPYYLYPEATYNIGLSKSSFRTKVAVGSNPWTKRRPDGDGEPGDDLRALRRRRTCARGCDLISAGPLG